MVLKGTVDSFKYINDSNHFGIFIFETPDIKEGNIVVTGNVFGVSEGDYIEVTGDEINHPVYGNQIKMTSFRAVRPTESDSVIKYLASGALKGVGPKLAVRIFTRFGASTLDILEKEPERLAEVKGISENMALSIATEYSQKRSMRDAMMFLQEYNISNTLAAKIYERYDDRIYKIVKEHPYKIAEDIFGVGFKTVDEIARKSGIKENSPERICAGIQYALLQAMEEGHTYLPKGMLIDQAFEVLSVEKEMIEEQINEMCLANKLTLKNPDKVFLKGVYQDEAFCANKLKCLKEAFVEKDLNEAEKEALKEKIERVTSEYSFELDQSQKEAIEAGINNGIFLLTGGPGTGKTTIIRALIEYFYNERMDVILAAPTGRAAKRMSEATGFEARTLHRLLEAKAVGDDSEKTRFNRNEDNPLEADVYIVDEMSMVDVFLFTAFLKAVETGSRVILVGDMNQLPSVGPGNIFRDLICSGYFRCSTLDTIHRQSENSLIIYNAHEINKGICPSLNKNAESNDFFFLERSDRRVLVRDVIELIQNRIPGKFKTDPSEIQILAPSKKGDLGVEALNKVLQNHLNPPSYEKKETARGENIFRVGDKVMQVKNNYDITWVCRGFNGIAVEKGEGVCNGDIGKIIAINEFEKSVTVLFDDIKEVVYTREELDELELAYAITIHKSQGSEYPAVVIPILDTPRQLLTRNLLYTAITRGTKCVMLMGSSEKIRDMVKNDGEKKRYTAFTDRLKEVMEV
ncbi:MAG: ATP-dependent RecD-like DNA helicase [Lachnospiraceae bacterium]|nr:ATP-dependent RecD-like DNA helicase [Lachnospiraceae bacterium]